jgi:hypothetical protein
MILLGKEGYNTLLFLTIMPMRYRGISTIIMNFVSYIETIRRYHVLCQDIIKIVYSSLFVCGSCINVLNS